MSNRTAGATARPSRFQTVTVAKRLFGSDAAGCDSQIRGSPSVRPGGRFSLLMITSIVAGVVSVSALPARGQCTYEWKPGEGLPGLNGDVYATAVYDDGGGPALYAGGTFTVAGNVPAGNIAKWNGSSWSALGSGMNSAVYALTVYNGTLIAGGLFTTAGGSSANKIAQWNSSTWSTLGSGLSSVVLALTVYNGDLIAAGNFTTAGGTSASRVARWNGSGWSALGSGMNNTTVYALTVYNGALIAGGDFTTAGGNSANRIAQWNGSSWSALGSGTSSFVLSLTVYNGALIAGGFFTAAGGNSVSSIAHWNGSSWSALGTGMNYYVRTLTVYNGALIAGGSFITAGSSGVSRIAQWNGSSWSALGSGMDNLVEVLTVYNGALIAGGFFATAGGNSANYIAQWNGSSWSALGSGMNDTVFALTVYNGALTAGGLFTTAGGNSANYVAQWNGSSWSALGSGMNNSVYALTVYNSGAGPELIAGGTFTGAGGNSANSVAQWNGSGWSALGSGMNGDVRALTVYDGALIAAGNYTTAGGNSANYIAQWNGSSWSAPGSGMNGTVQALTLYNGALIAAGDFTTAGGSSANHIAQWNGSSWSALGSGMNSSVYALTPYNGALIAGGGFGTAGGNSANSIAQWNGSGWSALGSGMNNSVYALTVYNGELLAGGYFTTAGGNVSAYWARWGPTIKATTVRVYVDASAGGANDGSSWANAYTDLHTALCAVTGAGDLVEEVWVADGTYYPDGGYKPTGGAHVPGSGDRAATFQLASGVSIYGHFAGTETLLSQRDPYNPAYETILSGDLNGDDGPNFARNGENSYHVVTGSGTDATAVLDDFTVRGGNADGPANNNADRGGGMLNVGGGPTVRGCTFLANRADGNGGAVSSEQLSQLLLRYCGFQDNAAGRNGGAVYDDGISLRAVGALFYNNQSAFGGGAILCQGGSATITNCLFESNSASEGGAIKSAGENLCRLFGCWINGNTASVGGGAFVSTSSGPPAEGVNCTFHANTTPGLGGGLLLQGVPVTLTNCILWQNSDSSGTGAGAQVRVDGGSGATVTHSIVQGGYAGQGNLSADPLFRDADGADNVAGTLDDDLRLMATSPGIDAGNNAAVPDDEFDLDNDEITNEPTPSGVNGYGRFDDLVTVADTGNGTAPIVDFGCYERVSNVRLVDSTPTAGPWVSSSPSLQATLNFARAYADEVTEIWVAAGVYKPDFFSGVITPGDRTASFELINGVKIYGGFTGTETSLSQRPADPDPSTINPATDSILSGDLLGNDGPDFANNAENSYHAVDCAGVGATTMLDGFTITAGNANLVDTLPGHSHGGGMRIIAGSPTVRNCRFVANRSDGNGNVLSGGGGLEVHGGAPSFIGCVFYGNSTLSDYPGGGAALLLGGTSTFRDCTFEANGFDGPGTSGGGGGGAIRAGYAPLTLVGCTFLGNHAATSGHAAGGALHLDGPATITNCAFIHNFSINEGGAIADGWAGAGSTVTNCTFIANGSSFGGAVACWPAGTALQLRNCTLVANSAYSGGGLFSGGNENVANCVFWNNTDNSGGGEAAQIYTGAGGAPVVNHSLIQGGWSGAGGTGNIGADPLFVANPYDGGDGWGDNPQTPNVNEGANDYYGNLRMLSGSPAIDAGSNAALDGAADAGDVDCDGNRFEAIPLDFDGNPRRLDDPATADCPTAPNTCGTAPIVDMGPYEFGAVYTTRLFVNPDAGQLPHDGSTWDHGFTTLQDALTLARSTAGCSALSVWVKTGVYNPDVDAAHPTGSGDRSATFQLLDHVQIYGGFTGTETQLAQRPSDPDPLTPNPVTDSILSGDLDGNDTGAPTDPSRSENSFHVVTGTGNDVTAVLDGFTITGGNADPSGGGSGGGFVTLGGGPTLRNCTLIGNTGQCATGLHASGGSVTAEGLTLSANQCTGTNPVCTDTDAGITGSQIELPASCPLGNCLTLTGPVDVFGGLFTGAGAVHLEEDAVLHVRNVAACTAEVITLISGNVPSVTVFTGPSPPQWQITSVALTQVVVSGSTKSWLIAPATLNWSSSVLDQDLSSPTTAEATFAAGGTITITGEVYDAADPQGPALFTGPGPVLTGTVGSFHVKESSAGSNVLAFVDGEKPEITPTGGFLVSNNLGFKLGGKQRLSMVMSAAAPPDLSDFTNASSIVLNGPSTLMLEPVTPPQGTTIVRSRITGTGRIEIDPGAKLVIASSGVLNLSDAPDAVCSNDPGVSVEHGLVTVNGSLVVQDTATIHNTHIEVKLAADFGSNNQIRHNDIRLLQASTGFGGEFLAAGSAKISCNTLYSEGDRYLDLDPDPSAPTHPELINNLIHVVIKEGKAGSQGALLELRAQDFDTGLRNSNPNGNSGAFAAADSPGFTADPSANWVLDMLEIEGGPDPEHAAKLNLTDRKGFEFHGLGVRETVYVNKLVLHPNATLNTALHTLYYKHLLLGDGTDNEQNWTEWTDPIPVYPDTLLNGSRVFDVPLLGFSLVSIDMDDDTEFDIRVDKRLTDPQDPPTLPPVYIGSIARITSDPDTGTNLPIPAGAVGVMDMRTQALGKQTAGSVAARGSFARAGDEDINVVFQYLFVANSNAELVVSLADTPDVSATPCGASTCCNIEPGDDRPHRCEVARVRMPPSGRPGSIGSGQFATFFGKFPRGSLVFKRGTYVEIELRGLNAQGTTNPPVASRVWIDNFDPNITACCSCGDLNFNGCTADSQDYLVLLAEYGQSLGQASVAKKACLDQVYGGDHYVDLMDLLGWDSVMDSDHPPPNACNIGIARADGSAGDKDLPPPHPLTATADRLLIAGKPNQPGQQNDYVYSIDSNAACAGVQAPAGADSADPTSRSNGRLIQDQDGNIYQLHGALGLLRTGTELVAQRQVIPPRSFTVAGDTVYVGIHSVTVNEESGATPPLADVAFGRTESTKNFAYVLPVVVIPQNTSQCPYRVAAKLQLERGTNGVFNGNYTLITLYGQNPADDPECTITSESCTVGQTTDVQHLREIEIDASGNLFILAAQALTPNNNWLLIYNENTGNSSEKRVPLSVPSPAALLWSATDNKLYLTSSANGTPHECTSNGDCDDSNVCTSDTCDTTRHLCQNNPIDGCCNVFGYGVQDVLAYTPPNPPLAPGGTVTVTYPVSGDLGYGYVSTITSFVEIAGNLYALGFTMPRFDPNISPNNSVFNGATGTINAAPALAVIDINANPQAVSGTPINCNNLGLPVSAIHTPISISRWRSVRTHGGADLSIELNPLATGNGVTGPTVETRSGGIQKIEVDFNSFVAVNNATNITVSDGVIGYTPAVSASGSTLTLNFAPALLPDQKCYTLTIGPAALSQTLTGNNICRIRSLQGDATGNGIVNLGDVLYTKKHIGQTAATFPHLDYNLTGDTIDAADMLAVKPLVTSPARRALCP